MNEYIIRVTLNSFPAVSAVFAASDTYYMETLLLELSN